MRIIRVHIFVCGYTPISQNSPGIPHHTTVYNVPPHQEFSPSTGEAGAVTRSASAGRTLSRHNDTHHTTNNIPTRHLRRGPATAHTTSRLFTRQSLQGGDTAIYYAYATTTPRPHRHPTMNTNICSESRQPLHQVEYYPVTTLFLPTSSPGRGTAQKAQSPTEALAGVSHGVPTIVGVPE